MHDTLRNMQNQKIAVQKVSECAALRIRTIRQARRERLDLLRTGEKMSPRNVVQTDFPRAELPLQDADRLINGKRTVPVRIGDNIVDKRRNAVWQPLQNVLSAAVIDNAAPDESPGTQHTPTHPEERDDAPYGKIIERRSHNDDVVFFPDMFLYIVEMRQRIHMIRRILAVRSSATTASIVTRLCVRRKKFRIVKSPSPNIGSITSARTGSFA